MAPARAEIVIDSPRAGEVLRLNPITIRGTARTFENNLVVRLRDSTGKTLTETFATATGEMGQYSPFQAKLYLTSDPGKRVTVQALEYSAKDGSERSVAGVAVTLQIDPIPLTLYFPDDRRSSGDCSQVFPAPRQVPKSISMARLTVETLMAGPMSGQAAQGFSNPFPKGSAVRSVNLNNGILRVDFNERLANVGGSCRALAIRASMEKTLGSLPGVKKVVILAGGSEKLALQP